ncbi:MAG: fructose-bisphosphate aldolase class I [Actinomycetota bacterium]|nr:fructose-bisphosphate aldolase class I [Actinomycetota bacterium]
MNLEDLKAVAKAMVAPGKGVLAADESNATISKRFGALDIESTEENRRAYRNTLLSTPGMEDYISGVILYDETIRQKADDGTPFPNMLERKGVLPGIKVDTGSKPLALAEGEQVTEGLDGLRERIAEYVSLGAKFAKWRAVIVIDESNGFPSDDAIRCNAHALARYAALCQEGGLVPIVEPEVLMDGENDIDTCYDVTIRTQRRVFTELAAQRIELEAMVLKPNMVISGKKSSTQASAQEVAEKTLRCLYRTVPGAVPGIAFLSGGQSAAVATEHLDLMNRMGPHPWQLTFSYGRALQDEALRTWKGDAANVGEAQKVFTHRGELTGAARNGNYNRDMETAGV